MIWTPCTTERESERESGRERRNYVHTHTFSHSHCHSHCHSLPLSLSSDIVTLDIYKRSYCSHKQTCLFALCKHISKIWSRSWTECECRQLGGPLPFLSMFIRPFVPWIPYQCSNSSNACNSGHLRQSQTLQRTLRFVNQASWELLKHNNYSNRKLCESFSSLYHIMYLIINTYLYT